MNSRIKQLKLSNGLVKKIKNSLKKINYRLINVFVTKAT